jgi:FMN phosphatase YigB (HAD superfamily)
VTLILFDLDNTLLGNEMNDFIPAYLQALAGRMAHVADPTVLIKTLLSATRQMIENTSPEKTLERKFDEAFFPPLNLIRDEVQSIIDDFYKEDFPMLQRLTQRLPEAVKVIQQIVERGDQAAVATNPLFPLTAIQQRLSWAGLPADQTPFVIIPSYETFHFAKPNPAFYAELLAQLGWPKLPVIMVGNDIDSDISAARKLELPVFWVNKGNAIWNAPDPPPPQGEISDFVPWLDGLPHKDYSTHFTSPASLLAVLRSTPAALDTLCHQKNVELGKRLTNDEWSGGEVLCHLRDVEMEVNLPRIKTVLSERNPFLAGKDTDPWADERKYSQQDGLQALTDFIRARLEVIKLLENLPSEDWDRQARHAIFGPTHLCELVTIITGHDILHVQQVYKVFKSQ